jgi:beta-galactosidase
VELFLNGTSLGSKDMPRNGHLSWSVPYRPGTLEAKAYTDDRLIASDKVETTGAPMQLRLSTDRTTLTADGEDVTMIAVSVLDAQGRVVPIADNEVNFSVTGDGHVVGVGNGDPGNHDPDKAGHRRAFNGLCMVIVGAGEKHGRIHLTASSPGLQSASLDLNVQ